MLRVVGPASRARSSMRYSPETGAPCGWRTAASKSCDTAFSMTSRECRRTRLGARRRLARTPAMVPVSAREYRSEAIVAARSGRSADASVGGSGDRLVVGKPEVPHLSKVLGGEPGVHRSVETVLGEIPAAATGHPRRLGEPLLD